MKRSRIAGTGGYLPERILTNAELERMVDTTNEWILERTGIRERHVVAPDQTTSDLATAAAQAALEMAGIPATTLDMIIVATTTPDRVFPATACLVQDRLGVRGCPAFDIQAVCTGFIYALATADQFIRSGSVRRALVVGAETFSRILDWTDRTTCVLFGDGAGAVVLEAVDEPGILSTHIHADGHYNGLLSVPWGVSQGYDRLMKDSSGFMLMQGTEVFRYAVRMLGAIVDETLAANGMQKSDVDWLVPHQANTRILEATAKKLSLPMDRVVMTVAHHGNTSAASVPLALDVAVRDGRIQRGDALLLEAFGGGFTWGSALVRY
ncbi:3-oxoacyl-(acyl carrier protein) synthase 3 [Gammaproteobacteria bacterium]